MLAIAVAGCGGGGGGGDDTGSTSGSATGLPSGLPGATPSAGDLVVDYSYPPTTHVDLFADVSISPTVLGLSGNRQRFAWTAFGAMPFPTGLSLDAGTGLISGRLNQAGTYYAMVNLAVDGYTGTLSQVVQIDVDSPFAMRYGDYPIYTTHFATAGSSVSVAPIMSGLETGDAVTFSISEGFQAGNTYGPLPAGWALDPTSGQIQGVMPFASFQVRIRAQITRDGMITWIEHGVHFRN